MLCLSMIMPVMLCLSMAIHAKHKLGIGAPQKAKARGLDATGPLGIRSGYVCLSMIDMMIDPVHNYYVTGLLGLHIHSEHTQDQRL